MKATVLPRPRAAKADLNGASRPSRDPKKLSPLRAVATSPMKTTNLTSTAKTRTAKPWALGAPIARMAAGGRTAAAADAGTDAADVDVVRAAAATVALAAIAVTGRPRVSRTIEPRINAKERE